MTEARKDAFRIRFAAFSLVLSGVSFVLFPVVRPFFDESSLQGAAEFASIRWVIAHVFGMAGFLLLSVGLFGVHILLRQTKLESRAFHAFLLSWVGTGLVLPFFGAKAFSLQVIGQAAVNQNSTGLVALVNEVRFGPGIMFITTGLLLVAAATFFLASAIWRSRILPKWSGIPLAIGFVVYLPQLQGAPIFQPIRIAVGLLIALG